MVQFWRENRRYFVWLRHQGGRWLRLIVQAFSNAFAPESALSAAAISYFALFSLFPLTLLTVAIGSIWIDPIIAEHGIISQLEFVAPAIGELLGQNIERVVRARGQITSFALITLIWSSSNIFNVLTRSIDRIWDLDVKRTVWRQRGLAILLALIISGLLLTASFAESAILTIINILLPPELQYLQPYTDKFWAVLLSIGLFSGLYYFLPHAKLAWRQVLPGAIGAGILWQLAKQGFLAFIAIYLSRSNLVYGSVATIIVFLTWAYVSSLIFMFGAHLNVAYDQV